MNFHFTFVFALILFILSACALQAEISQISAPTFSPTHSQTPTNSLFENLPANPIVTWTPTPGEEIIVMTSHPPEIVLTALNLQLDSSGAKLTQAAQQISTLSAEFSALETQLAVISTDTAKNTSSDNTNSSGYKIPSNVYTVVTVEKATIFISKSNNKNGAPIMVPYEPRVYYPPGTETWVYKDKIKADGGAIYYESFDPDGQSDLKVYFSSKQIQIRLPNGNPDPDNFPGDVAKAKITDDTVVFVVTSYDKQGKPIMETYKPYIRYSSGKFEIVYPEYVVATGGSHWYPIYDPDGKPSGYIRSTFISFPEIWN